MTLSIAWLRNVGATQELVMAADGRLRFGCAWDCCPKIVLLDRGDAAMCFAGDTTHAYPLMLQVRSSIEQHQATKTRERDLMDLRSHILDLVNGMRDHIHDLPKGQRDPNIPETTLLFGGFSWKQQQFVIWLLHFDRSIGKFTFRPASPWRGQADSRLIAFTGDYIPETRARLVELLKSRGKLDSGGLDMEPFEVLRDVIREGAHPAIGGRPQLVKIYRHLNAVPIGVWWPSMESRTMSSLGRPLLECEKTMRPLLDPDSLETAAAWSFQ